MARKRIAALLYVTAGVAAVLDPSPVGLALATGCVILLTIGYRFRGDFASVASGWLLYLPLATVFAFAFGPFWSYLASGAYLAIVTERLSFENQLSVALEARAGVDAEGKRLADELSGRHARRLATVAFFVVLIGCLSLAASVVLSAVTVLILASVLLVIVVGMYATRAAARGGSSL
ncbi:MAG: hypothetical protein OK449_04460 [Thaumarchaeota archaeon]|nr:hypothetical protein [Nitrososphaerota archaeon]